MNKYESHIYGREFEQLRPELRQHLLSHLRASNSAFDKLAERAGLKVHIEELAEHGEVVLVEHNRDIDEFAGRRFDHFVRLPAIVSKVEKAIESHYMWADWPTGHSLIKPSELT